MPSILSLKQDKTDKTGWHERDAGPYDLEYANALEEPAGTEPHKMLAAIPSPFARLHVFDVAFAFLSDAKRSQAGDTVFHRVVSECLDAMELLFHWNTHKASGTALKVLRWDATGELQALKGQDSPPEHRLLGEALALYLDQDAAMSAARSETWLLTVEDHGRKTVLAISSPLTLVAPAPAAAELARRLELKPPGRDFTYFSVVRSLPQRDASFRAYLDRLFEERALRNRCGHLYSYIERVNKGSQNLAELARYRDARYDDIEEDGAPLTMHGQVIWTSQADPVPEIVRASKRRIRADRIDINPLPILLVDGYDSEGTHRAAFRAPVGPLPNVADRRLPDFRCPYPFVVAGDFLEDHIIKLPYPLNTEAFVLPKASTKLESAYLPPLKPLYYEFFSPASVANRLQFEPTPSGDGVKCTLEIPLQERSVKLAQTYYPQPQLAGTGRVVLGDFGLAVFPAVTWHHPGTRRTEQPYLQDQAFALVEERRRRGEPWRTSLAFHGLSTRGTLSPIADASKGVQERTPKGDATYSTKYYSVAGSSPDVIEVTTESDVGSQARALLGLAASPVQSGNKEFVVAVDFGTTNSHVTLAERTPGGGPVQILPLLPRSPDTGKSGIATLHNRPTTSTLAETVELALRHEFVPPDIGDQVLMPTRTAVSERPHGRAGSLFAEANIAFFVYRHPLRKPDEERILTRLKWARKNDRETEHRVRLFLREVLMLTRAQILLNGGDPARTRLLWFWPLSFSEYLRSTLERLWREEAGRVLDVGADAIVSITESAAPYYYHEARADAIAEKPVLSIDVGGGSTDVVFFDAKEPKFGTSFNFAGNALWGSGFNQANETSQWNGAARLAHQLLQTANQRLDTVKQVELDSIRRGFAENPDLSTSEEVANLGFKTDAYIGFTDELRRNEAAKLIVLLHFTAIVYHCAQLMRELKLERPQLVSLSGNGCAALAILDATTDKRYLAAHAAAVFDAVYDHWTDIAAAPPDAALTAHIREATRSARPRSLGLLIAERLKQATAEGGIYWYLVSGARRVEPAAFVLLCGPGTLHPREAVPAYATVGQAQIAAAAAEFRRFCALFHALAGAYDRFGLSETTVARAMPVLTAEVEDTIRTGLDRRMLSVESAEERAVETLFFYPLVDKLWRLSRQVQ